MVSDMAFVQTSSGAAAAAGTFLNIGATSTRLKGPMGRTSGLESSEETKQRNLALLRNYQHAFKMSSEATSAAERHLKLAYDYSFTKGRHIEHVIAVCLYMGCKLQKTSHMLIDFADVLRINVYELGSTYLKWLNTLKWESSDPIWDINHPLDPSIYITRFVALLEFGDDEAKIKADAIRIATRFKEDWIHEGRRTAGICGASIYLAAQMNNYRRSIQEIVQVCKIADTTILKRLEEFSATASANLTVGDFRVTERPTEAADPPAFTRARQSERELREGPGAGRVAHRGRKRRRDEMEGEDDAEESRASSVPQSLPTEDEPLFLTNESPQRRITAPEETRPLRAPVSVDALSEGIFEGIGPLVPGGRAQSSMANSTAGDGSIDTAMQEQGDVSGTVAIRNGRKDSRTIDELAVNPAHVDDVRDLVESQAGQMILANVRPADVIQQDSDTQVLQVEEDALQGLDEEELDNYICDDGEAQMKERVWTEFNLDYLRKLAAKRFKDQTGEDINQKKKRKPKPKKTFTPGKTAFESVQAMMKNNKQFSKRINYNALKSALPDMLDEKIDEKDDDEYDDKEDEEKEDDAKEDETIAELDDDPLRRFEQMRYRTDHEPNEFYEEA